jgi:hypothetical protein
VALFTPAHHGRVVELPLLRRLGTNEQQHLVFRPPDGSLVVDEEFPIHGYPGATAHLSIWRAPEKLEEAKGGGRFERFGLIIKGRRAVHECSLVYVPSGQGGSFLVRANLDSRLLSGIIRAAVPAVDKTAQLEEIQPLERSVNDMASEERLIATLSTVFGAVPNDPAQRSFPKASGAGVAPQTAMIIV